MTLARVVDQLDASLPGRVTRDASSAALTTYRCGGPFAALVRIDDDADFRRVAEVLVDTEVGVLVVGRGSNLLVADSGFDGIALALGGQFEEIEVDDRLSHVVAGGAVALPVLARRVTAAGLGGLEFFVGIPGSVGGAVCMNAGGHGRDTKDVLLHARVGSLDDGEIRELAPSELELGYRRSAIGPRAVVLALTSAG
jgi:UDP-N-acetylmuramate dehydrogenase